MVAQNFYLCSTRHEQCIPCPLKSNFHFLLNIMAVKDKMIFRVLFLNMIRFVQNEIELNVANVFFNIILYITI